MKFLNSIQVANYVVHYKKCPICSETINNPDEETYLCWNCYKIFHKSSYPDIHDYINNSIRLYKIKNLLTK